MKKLDVPGRYLRAVTVMVVAAAALGTVLLQTPAQGQEIATPPRFKVDPFWPKPLPEVKDAQGNLHPWITGQLGGVCVDSHDHVFTLNRAWQNSSVGKLESFESLSAVPSPPVIAYDAEGSIVTSWGDASVLQPGGLTKVMPEGLHGCFVDYQDNVWIAGNGDGVVQKYSHDGRLLLQIGIKGQCDGDVNQKLQNVGEVFPTCGSPGGNSSKTMLNNPADMDVDSQPDPVTRQRGSVYIADGYGNHRIVVFDAKGKYLRQWGSAGSDPGQFSEGGGGHPHCVILGKDGLVYVCDRGNNRIQVFDKVGKLQRIIPVEPEGYSYTAALRINDLAFSNDEQQTFLYTCDVSAGKIWVIDRASGKIVAGFGRVGHYAGEFIGAHMIAVDSKGNLYTTEIGTGRRIQKFVRQ